jgi:hypothetical protein
MQPPPRKQRITDINDPLLDAPLFVTGIAHPSVLDDSTLEGAAQGWSYVDP